MTTAQQTRIGTRGFMLAFIAKLFSSCVFLIYTATLVTYLYAHYQASSGAAGLAVGIFILGSMVGRVLSAQLDMRFSRKDILVASAFAFLVLSAMYLLPVSFSIFVLLRAVHGVAFGFVNNVITIVATDMLPSERLGEGLAIFALSVSIATTLAPITGVCLMQAISYQAVKVAAVLFAFVVCVAAMAQKREVIDVAIDRTKGNKSAVKLGLRDLFEKNAMPVSFLVAIACLCYAGSVTPYVVPYSEQSGLGMFSFLYFAIYTLTLVIARPAMGMLQDRKGSNVIMYPALICLVLGLLVLAFVPSLLGIVLAGILLGIGHGTVISGGQTIVVRLSSHDRVGFATSTYFSFMDFGTGIGPAVMGLLFDQLGYGGMYFCAALIAAGLIFGYAMACHMNSRQNMRFQGHSEL